MPDITTAQSHQRDILIDVRRYAAVDRDFRERLLNEPRTTVSEVAGQALPEDFTIRFIEKDEGTDALVVLADFVPETMELSQEELKAVADDLCAGDTCWWTICWETRDT